MKKIDWMDNERVKEAIGDYEELTLPDPLCKIKRSVLKRAFQIVAEEEQDRVVTELREYFRARVDRGAMDEFSWLTALEQSPLLRGKR